MNATLQISCEVHWVKCRYVDSNYMSIYCYEFNSNLTLIHFSFANCNISTCFKSLTVDAIRVVYLLIFVFFSIESLIYHFLIDTVNVALIFALQISLSIRKKSWKRNSHKLNAKAIDPFSFNPNKPQISNQRKQSTCHFEVLDLHSPK